MADLGGAVAIDTVTGVSDESLGFGGDGMLRLLPPMVLSAEQADRGLGVLGEVLGSAATE